MNFTSALDQRLGGIKSSLSNACFIRSHFEPLVLVSRTRTKEQRQWGSKIPVMLLNPMGRFDCLFVLFLELCVCVAED